MASLAGLCVLWWTHVPSSDVIRACLVTQTMLSEFVDFLYSIDSLRDLSHHRNLQDLDLSHNTIEVLEGLSALKCLRILKMNNNKIRQIEGLDGKGGKAGNTDRTQPLFPTDNAYIVYVFASCFFPLVCLMRKHSKVRCGRSKTNHCISAVG